MIQEDSMMREELLDERESDQRLAASDELQSAAAINQGEQIETSRKKPGTVGGRT